MDETPPQVPQDAPNLADYAMLGAHVISAICTMVALGHSRPGGVTTYTAQPNDGAGQIIHDFMLASGGGDDPAAHLAARERLEWWVKETGILRRHMEFEAPR